MFIGMVSGIGILDLRAFYATGETRIMFFDQTNGFLGQECKQNGVYSDSKGYTWVATSDRVTRIDPRMIRQNNSEPVIYLRSVEASSGQNDTIESLSPDQPAKLRWYQKDLRFTYHALSYHAPERVLYSYLLKGYDKGWSAPAPARYANYTNLKPGDYEFRVKACNENGIWCDTPATFSFSIVPAIWQTRGFLITANIFFFLLAVYAVYYYLRQKRKKQEEREKLDKHFTELKLMTIRNQMDPHFTFNAITSLGTLIYTEKKEAAYDYLVKFSDLIRKTLESSHKVARPLQDELDFIRNYLDLQKYRFKNKFEYRVDIGRDVDLHTPIPRMIIETHVENALKHGLVHSAKEGLIEVKIYKEDRTLVIEITDNGIGREESRWLNEGSTRIGLKVTEQFYTLINKYNKEKITRKIIDLYDTSGNPAGTKVIINIPQGIEYGF